MLEPNGHKENRLSPTGKAQAPSPRTHFASAPESIVSRVWQWQIALCKIALTIALICSAGGALMVGIVFTGLFEGITVADMILLSFRGAFGILIIGTIWNLAYHGLTAFR